jgi:PHD-finger
VPLSPQVPANILTLMCELCGGGQHEEAMILCDACDRGCHLFCLNPPLDAVPEGAWTCPLCVAEAHAQGASRCGSRMGLEEFERAASAFKRTWWGNETRARKVGLYLVLGQSCMRAVAILSAGGVGVLAVIGKVESPFQSSDDWSAG